MRWQEWMFFFVLLCMAIGMMVGGSSLLIREVAKVTQRHMEEDCDCDCVCSRGDFK